MTAGRLKNLFAIMSILGHHPGVKVGFDLRVISIGVIITRCDELQRIFNALGRGSSYGASTTHMAKLLPRIEGGGGAGCPLLVFGIKRSLYVEDI